MIDVAAALGADCGELLDGTGIDAATLERADARVSLLQQYAMLCRRAVVLTGEPALAYEFGLRSTLTTHGILGYGLINGLPGFVTLEPGEILQTTALHIEDGRVTGVYVVRNPEKLRHVRNMFPH